MTTTSRTRLYVVATTDTGLERLIRAETKAKAVTLASVARIATQSDLERLFSVGVIVEVSQLERPEPPPLPPPPAPPPLPRLDGTTGPRKRGRPKGSPNKATAAKRRPRRPRPTPTTRSESHV
jgi:hypothetical protein